MRSILNVTLTVSHPKKVQGVAIIFKHFYIKFFFSRDFQAPLKSNIKFQGFSRTSRSSTNHGRAAKPQNDCNICKESLVKDVVLDNYSVHHPDSGRDCGQSHRRCFFTKPSEQLESRDCNEKEKLRKRQNRLMNSKNQRNIPVLHRAFADKENTKTQ